jgi:hypothetical protein
VKITGRPLASRGQAPSFAEREHERAHYRAHGCYDPARCYIVRALPPGTLRLPIGCHHCYFRSPRVVPANEPNSIIVSPPPGIVIPVLPSGTAAHPLRSPYYYANNIYYASGVHGCRAASGA